MYFIIYVLRSCRIVSKMLDIRRIVNRQFYSVQNFIKAGTNCSCHAPETYQFSEICITAIVHRHQIYSFIVIAAMSWQTDWTQVKSTRCLACGGMRHPQVTSPGRLLLGLWFLQFGFMVRQVLHSLIRWPDLQALRWKNVPLLIDEVDKFIKALICHW